MPLREFMRGDLLRKSLGAHFFMEIDFVFGRATVPPKKLILFLPAAFCRLAKSRNRFEQTGMVGKGQWGSNPDPNFWGRFLRSDGIVRGNGDRSSA